MLNEQSILKAEEYYEKLSAVLRVLDHGIVPENDIPALTWIAMDYLVMLGKIIGIEPKK